MHTKKETTETKRVVKSRVTERLQLRIEPNIRVECSLTPLTPLSLYPELQEVKNLFHTLLPSPEMPEQVPAGKVKTSIPGLKISEAALKAMQNNKLPQSKKSAPAFDKEELENLERYFAELEDIFKANDVVMNSL
ncbi:hypothetical protein K435DRAFT_874054 [Dendrothele bispora CBS 962.96]|uniref:Uncharacterized protein n=1 Tax=Dendrothele bispora (strain CBS 962.96) TaxID=1314807 RepID=A0A4S8KXX7_DENBC|nr:hypothetical protein K435DRAFT_874054 [Dendrothele bispora CBS 962.96]